MCFPLLWRRTEGHADDCKSMEGAAEANQATTHSWILRALDTIKAEILATDVSVEGEEGTGSPKVSGLKFALFPLISVFFWTRHHWSFLSLPPKAFRFYWVNFISLSLYVWYV